MNEDHRNLLRTMCVLAGIEDYDQVLRSRSVAFDGVVFSLLHEQTAFGPMVVIYCEYGPVPPSKEAAVQRRLMEINLVLAQEFMPVSFCINPDSNNVLLVMRVLLADTTAALMLQTLKAIAEQALRWRETLYLETDKVFGAASALGLDRPGSPDRLLVFGGRRGTSA